MHKNEFMDRMVNDIQLSWMLKRYRTCNSTVGFSKNEIHNRLLGDVTLLRVILGVTWTQPYIYGDRKIHVIFGITLLELHPFFNNLFLLNSMVKKTLCYVNVIE